MTSHALISASTAHGYCFKGNKPPFCQRISLGPSYNNSTNHTSRIHNTGNWHKGHDKEGTHSAGDLGDLSM
jgi:hypothetical protein